LKLPELICYPELIYVDARLGGPFLKNKLIQLKQQLKTLKFIFFIPVCMITLGILSFAFMSLLNWTIVKTGKWYNDLNIVYFILLIPFFWGTIWGIFKLSAVGLAALLIPVSPDKKFSFYTLSLLSLINCIGLVVYYWTRDISYSWKVILMSLIISGFILDFSASIVLVFSKKDYHGFDE